MIYFKQNDIIKLYKKGKIVSALLYVHSTPKYHYVERDIVRYLAKNLMNKFTCLLYDKALLEDTKKLLGKGEPFVNYYFVPERISSKFDESFDESINLFMLNDSLDKIVEKVDIPHTLSLCIDAIELSIKEEKRAELDRKNKLIALKYNNRTKIESKRGEMLCNDCWLRLQDPMFYMNYTNKRDKWLL